MPFAFTDPTQVYTLPLGGESASNELCTSSSNPLCPGSAPQSPGFKREPTAANSGNVVVETFNDHFAGVSTNNGKNWTVLDANQVFGNVGDAANGVVGDQTVIFVPQKDIFVWQMQYNNPPGGGHNIYRLAVAKTRDLAAAPGDAANWTTKSCYYDIDPSFFGIPDPAHIDRPDVALSQGFVWYSANVFLAGGAKQSIVFAFGLADLATCSNSPQFFPATFPETGYALTQGAVGTMYWGAIPDPSANTIVLRSMSEASMGTVTSASLSVAATLKSVNGPFSCVSSAAPSADLCSGMPSRMMTAYVANGVLGFLWHLPPSTLNYSPPATFDYPFVMVARYDETTKAWKDFPAQWNDTGAVIYPSIDVNARGHLGGGFTYVGVAAGSGQIINLGYIWDDISPPVSSTTDSPWQTTYLSAVSAGASQGWGDYFSSRKHSTNRNTWVISIQNRFPQVSGSIYADGSPFVEFSWIGRLRDGNDTSCSTGHCGTVARVGTFAGVNGVWNEDYNNNGVYDPNLLLDRQFSGVGQVGDVPVPADWSGNGRARLAVYRHVGASAEWHIDEVGDNNIDGPSDLVLTSFGTAADSPIAGRWTKALASAQVGVFTAAGGWRLDDDGSGTMNGGDEVIAPGKIGQPGDVPVTGVWVAGGTRSMLGVYRPSNGTFYLDANDNRQFDGCGGPPAGDLCAQSFGSPGDVPVVGDWSGDGVTKVGVARAAGGAWNFFLDLNGNGVFDAGDQQFTGGFGASTATPVAAAW